MTSPARRTFLLLLAATVAACGGGSSPDPGTPPAASVVLQGAITARGVGEIEVNGVTLTTPPTVKIEKAERPERELKVGMVVRVKAHGGEALEVEFEDAATGKIDAVFADDSISVGGQRVRVDDSTEFEDNLARLGSLAVDDRVRVSGVPDDKGGLRASRIDKVGGVSDDFEVKGVVSGLGATGFTLKLSSDAGPEGTYTVTLAGGATLPAGLANGSFVEVRSLKPVQAGQVIEAASISIEDRLPGQPGGEVEVEGIVTSGGSASFVAAGITVTTTDATLWVGGVAADLIPGVKVEAEGAQQADGSLAARKVSFRYSARLQGAVTVLDRQADGTGAVRVNGIRVTVDHRTDRRDALSGLADGELVELRGYPGREASTLVATRLERRNDDRPVIQGVVTARSGDTLTILGKTISTAAVEAGGFHDFDPSSGVDGPSISPADFFARIVLGETVVKARGRAPASFADPVLTAKEVELEGER